MRGVSDSNRPDNASDRWKQSPSRDSTITKIDFRRWIGIARRTDREQWHRRAVSLTKAETSLPFEYSNFASAAVVVGGPENGETTFTAVFFPAAVTSPRRHYNKSSRSAAVQSRIQKLVNAGSTPTKQLYLEANQRQFTSITS